MGCGTDGRQNVACHSTINTRPVARLSFQSGGSSFVCTGWLVFNSRHLLTNEHCINSAAEMRSALADVDFNQGVTPSRSVRFRRLLLSDATLDYYLAIYPNRARTVRLLQNSGLGTLAFPSIYFVGQKM